MKRQSCPILSLSSANPLADAAACHLLPPPLSPLPQSLPTGYTPTTAATVATLGLLLCPPLHRLSTLPACGTRAAISAPSNAAHPPLPSLLPHLPPLAACTETLICCLQPSPSSLCHTALPLPSPTTAAATLCRPLLLPLVPTACRCCYLSTTYLPPLLCSSHAILNPFSLLPTVGPLLLPSCRCVAASHCRSPRCAPATIAIRRPPLFLPYHSRCPTTILLPSSTMLTAPSLALLGHRRTPRGTLFLFFLPSLTSAVVVTISNHLLPTTPPSSATFASALSHIAALPLLPSSSSACHVVVVVHAASCSHATVDRHCPFPSPLCCFPLRLHSHLCHCHHLPFHPSLAPTGTHFLCSHTKYYIVDAMAMDDALDVRFKTFEAYIEDRLQELFREFRRSRFEKYDHRQDTGYTCKREEFPKWEDGDPIGWISCAKKFFYFHRTPEESIVEIASTQLEGDVIQWYDLYETYRGVPLWDSSRESS
ncbi:hypothetical protein B296_00012450 [Ensete ventricosum]|uniref:Retrotransposon gag domain-containing protein n=1 Tax=Ensete ventricosum TaxID=4639 RepID=A0A426ZZY8_ENSVE|nr:hypothetical protein B296_00012450 [Ensete ventricosum]